MPNEIPPEKWIEYQLLTQAEWIGELAARIERLEKREREVHALDERIDELESTAKILKWAARFITAILVAVIVGWAQRLFEL